MALKSIVFKADLNIADMDRNYYHDHLLTIAQHPSETDERMMLRLLAFALNAQEDLAFGKGLSTDDEPDLWLKDLTGAIELWIEVGQPDEKRLRKAAGRASNIIVYSYGGNVADIWWQQNRSKLIRMEGLSVYKISSESSAALADMAQRTMELQCTIQDGQVWIADRDNRIELEIEKLN